MRKLLNIFCTPGIPSIALSYHQHHSMEEVEKPITDVGRMKVVRRLLSSSRGIWWYPWTAFIYHQLDPPNENGWILRFLDDSGGIWRFLDSSGVILMILEVYEGIWMNLEVSGIFWRFLDDTRGIWMILKESGWFWRNLNESWGFWKILKVSGWC